MTGLGCEAALPDLRIVYDDVGAGPPVLFLHGFASTRSVNWQVTGWHKRAEGEGFRLIAPDQRGHGASGKFYSPADYALPRMAADAVALLDALGIARAPVVGYSMGASVVLRALLDFPDRFEAGVIAGAGLTSASDRASGEIAAALEAPSREAAQGALGAEFRAFAERTKSDLPALAACIRGVGRDFRPGDFARIGCPVLVIAGDADEVARDPEPLAALIPGAELHLVPRKNHMNVIADRDFQETICGFLARRLWAVE